MKSNLKLKLFEVHRSQIQKCIDGNDTISEEEAFVLILRCCNSVGRRKRLQSCLLIGFERFCRIGVWLNFSKSERRARDRARNFDAAQGKELAQEAELC